MTAGFYSESGLRKWVQRKFFASDPNKPRWIEPAPGCTPGLPDSFITTEDHRIIFVELKMATIKRGVYRFELTDEQRREFPRFIAAGIPLVFLIGLAERPEPLVVLPDPDVLMGFMPFESVGKTAFFMVGVKTGKEYLDAIRKIVAGSEIFA